MTGRRCLSITASLLFAAVPVLAANSSCEDLEGKPLLGAERVALAPGEPVLLHVQQHDVDVVVATHRENRRTLHNAPGGRNGAEWIYADASAASSIELCIYAARGYAHDRSYTLTRIELSTLPATQLDALHRMSDAGIRWASDTQTTGANAIELYDSVASARVSLMQVSDHAALYAQLARMQRFEYDAALRGLAPLTARAHVDYVSYMARWATGDIYNRKRQGPAAQQALEESLATLKAHETRAGTLLLRDKADITNLLGETHLSAGRLDAGEFLVRAARLLSGADPQLLGFIHNNLGYLYLLRANQGPDRAQQLSLSLAEHLKAREHLTHAFDKRSLSIVENNLGSVYERLGHLRKARAHYEEALRLIDGTHDPLRFQVLYWNLGNIYQYLGDQSKAERYLAAALSLAQRSLPQDATRLRCALGTTLRQIEHVEQALAEHEACRNGAQASKSPKIETEAWLELAIDHRIEGRSTEAWNSIQAAHRLVPQLGSADLHAKILIQTAELLQEQGAQDAARESILTAIATSLAARYTTVHIDALASALKINIEQRRESDALRFGLQAAAAIESVHAHLDAERLGPAWSAQTRAIYEQLALLSLTKFQRTRQVANLHDMLLILERSRAISLRQQFSAPPALLQQVDASHTLAALSTLANEQARRADLTGRTSMPLAYYHEHDLLTRSRLAGVDHVPVPAPLPTHELQSSLAPDQLALYYFVAGGRMHLLALTRANLEIHDLGLTKRIEDLVDAARRTTAQHHKDSLATLRQLSGLILPATKLPPALHWIIVADGALHAVPFAALDLSATPDVYKPVMEQHTVRVVPSLSAYWMDKHRPPRQPSADLAIFANPAFGTHAPAAAEHMDRDRRGWTQVLPTLLWTAKEAEHLRNIFGPERTLVYTDKQATRKHLRSAPVRDAKILHLASHGYFNSNNPDNVGFALSPDDGPEFDSGFVTVSELFMQRFNNELVVISGCDTAMGLEQGGEGMLSLARGFMAQGASHVVSTLWAVSDRASAEFMKQFYTHLSAGRPISESLRAAQHDLRTQTTYKHPFFWGGYVLATVEPDDTLQLGR